MTTSKVKKVFPIKERNNFFKYVVMYGSIITKDKYNKEMYFDSKEQAVIVCKAQNTVRKTLNGGISFIIPDTNNSNIPIEDTNYYAWLLEKRPNDIHRVNTKVEYLESIGFVVSISKLSENDLLILKWIEQYYFDRNIKPNLAQKEK